MADLQKKLKVKTGTCKRLNKDLEYYKKEEKQIQEKIEKLKQENADAYTIKKQEEVLGESLTMITDSRNRLETALTDIRDHMEEIRTTEGENGPIQSSTDWSDALVVIEQVSSVFN
jgi:tubulin-specific chaperone A